MSNIYRDRTLNQVSEQDIDSNLRVAGWVENIRDHGGVSFIDLKRYVWCASGSYQRCRTFKGNQKEECISIEGIMEKRDEETYNPKIPSRYNRT